jgi:Zn-dependent oligopeptidase
VLGVKWHAVGIEQGVEEELKHWDITYWAERLRESRFNITDEELRPYFALPNVLKGLFQVCAPVICNSMFSPSWPQ